MLSIKERKRKRTNTVVSMVSGHLKIIIVFKTRSNMTKENVILDKYTIIEEKRTRIIYNWLQYFSVDSLREEFEENGFKVESLEILF